MNKDKCIKINKLAFWLLLLGSSFSTAALAEIKFEIAGLDKQLKANANAYLATIAEEDLDQAFRFESQVREKVTESLQAMGYFHPVITLNGQRQSVLGKPIYMLDVKAGKPVTYSAVDVQIHGEASSDPEFIALLKTMPKRGDIVDQGVYEDFKGKIQKLAISHGYFDGNFTETKLEISPGLNEAFLHLHFNSGIRFQYGQITYHNSQIELDRLNSLRPFNQGDPYLVTELSDFNQALAATSWFSSALVEADIKQASAGTVPISVNLDPAPRNLFETGIGYSTNTGARFTGSWAKPWINSRGHSVDSSVYVSKPKQTLESAYKIPLDDVANQFYKFQVGLEHLDLNDTESLEVTASISRHWLYETGWQRILFLRWLYSDFTQAGESDDSNLLLPGVSFTRLRTRGGVMPYWGDKQSITFETASELWGSDINLYRLFGETAWIRSTSKDNTHRFITKLQAGIDVTENLDLVPPSLRFFTGGDNSIRGYGYESISPEDANGELIGGEYMATASIEYNYQFVNNWWVALFADAGDAWIGAQPDWKTSAGIGIIWKSPVGPVRFDIAHGFQNNNDKVLFHFSLGPEL